MATFSTFKDMFKWNNQLFEDDFNQGKLYTVKHKKDLGNKTVSLECFLINLKSFSYRKLKPTSKLMSHLARLTNLPPTIKLKVKSQNSEEFLGKVKLMILER
jgi:hypothetical protein